MSVTALLILGMYSAGLLLGLRYHPLFALLSYFLIFYQHPPVHWWGADIPNLRYSLYAALVTLVSIWIKRTSPAVVWNSSGAMLLLLGYAAWAWIQNFWAISTYFNTDGAMLFTKFAILFYAIYKIGSDEKKFEWILWAHVAGCFMFGWEAFNTNVSGRLETIGGPGVDDANFLAAHMVTGLVVAGFLVLSNTGWRRWIPLMAIPFIMNTIILTQSRGGVLSTVFAGLAGWFYAPKGYRAKVAGSGLLCAALLLVLANEDFWSRIESQLFANQNIEEEGRLKIIGPQFQMFLDHPLGVGHRGNLLLSPQYMPPELMAENGYRSAHNTFVAALVDQGFPGALMLVLMYIWAFFRLDFLRRQDKRGLPVKLGVYRATVGAALASCLLSGVFLNQLRFEVQVWLIALLAALDHIVRSHFANEVASGMVPGKSRKV
jgi:hypothetical protein